MCWCGHRSPRELRGQAKNTILGHEKCLIFHFLYTIGVVTWGIKKRKKKKRFWPLELQTLFRVDHTRSQKKNREMQGEKLLLQANRLEYTDSSGLCRASLRIHTAQRSAPHWLCLNGARPSYEKISYFQKSKPLTSNEICLIFLCVFQDFQIIITQFRKFYKPYPKKEISGLWPLGSHCLM